MKKYFSLLLSTVFFAVMFSPANANAPVDCKLQENSYPRNLNNHLFSAFPALDYNIPATGNFTIAIIPVHFSDLPADSDPYEYVKNDMDMFVDYFKVQSSGKVNFQWRKSPVSILLPGSSQDYAVTRSTFDINFAQMAIASSDPYFDYTGIQNVVFILPKNQQILPHGVQGFYRLTHSQRIYTNESMINNYMFAGRYFVDYPGHATWSYWAHELLHGFALPDLYPQPWSRTVRNLRPEGADGWGAYNGWDIMADQDGPSRSISTWTKWTLGWLENNQVLCQSPSEFNNQKISLVYNEDSKPGIKSIIIPFTSTKALVIESRRETKFNRQSSGDNVDDGILVYEIDTTRGHGEMPILPIKRNAKINIKDSHRTPPYYDALLDLGETIQYENLYIKYISNSAVDQVVVSTLPIIEEVKSNPEPTSTTIQKPEPKKKKAKKKIPVKKRSANA